MFDRKKARYLSLKELEKIREEAERSGVCPDCSSKRIKEYCDGLPYCPDCGWCCGFDASKGYFEYRPKRGKRETGEPIA